MKKENEEKEKRREYNIISILRKRSKKDDQEIMSLAYY